MSREGRVTLGHRAEALLVWGVGACIRVLPEGIALSLGRVLGWTAGVLLRIRYRVVLEYLGRAFPGASGERRRRTAAQVFSHIGREGVALLRLSDLGPRELWERTEVEGLDAVRDALSRERGVVVLAGHLGNWEIGGAALAVRDIPLDVVGRRQSNPLFDRRLRRTREELGMRVIYRDEGVRPILRALREPRAVALVADQNVRSGGVFVDFFGHPAATTRGPATLARRTGALVVLGTSLALPGGRARYRIRLRPLPLPDTGEPEEDDRRFLQAYMVALEEEVRDAPHQYFWPHRRWKTRPAAPLPQDAAPSETTRSGEGPRSGTASPRDPEEPSRGGIGTSGEDPSLRQAPEDGTSSPRPGAPPPH